LTAPPGRITLGTPFPKSFRWNAERQAVEFGVGVGKYRGVVRVPRRGFQRLLPEQPTTERCVEAYYVQRTRYESIAEPNLRRRQLTEYWNVKNRGARSPLSAKKRPATGPPPNRRSRTETAIQRAKEGLRR
jgi:hypothetical protein